MNNTKTGGGDPQQGTHRDMWMAHGGLIHLEDMPEQHLINAFKTCQRHSSPKAQDVYRQLEARDIEWRVTQ